jgi:hypothetical protein
MAGKAKSCYLSVTDLATNKTVLNKVFFKMADLNQFISTSEFKEQYPKEKFHLSKEIY